MTERRYHRFHGAGIPEMSRTLCVAVAALLITAMRISAHHAFAAEYDENKRVRRKQARHSLRHRNRVQLEQSAWLYVDERDETGKVASWSFEMGSPGGLIRRGWKKAELKKGDHVTLEGYGAKDGSNKANATTVTVPDGRKLFGGFQTTPGAPAR